MLTINENLVENTIKPNIYPSVYPTPYAEDSRELVMSISSFIYCLKPMLRIFVALLRDCSA